MKPIRDDFPFFDTHSLIYLDNAATTQKPRIVLEAMNDYYHRYCSNIHRGSHDLSNKATLEYESARQKIAAYLGTREEEIVFTRGTTEAINLVASTFVKGRFTTVMISELEHHSNIVPWQLNGFTLDKGLVVIPVDETLNIQLDVYTDLLRNHPGSFISLTHISNAFGIINPIKQLIDIAHSYGCTIMIDGAQALAHLSLDLRELDADFYAVSAHKAYGPTGIGALYGKYELLSQMPPYQGGGAMIHDVTFRDSTYLEPPWRFEAGTQAIGEVIGFGAAIEYLQRIAPLREEERRLHTYAIQQLQKIPNLCFYTDAENVSANISFNIQNIHHDDLGILLSKQHIMVRTGHHCAMPIMHKLGIKGTVRLSLALYNTAEEIDMTVIAILKALEHLQ